MKKLILAGLVIITMAVCGYKSEGDKALEEAKKLRNSQRYTQAIELLTKAIEKSPNHAGLFYERGYCYHHEGYSDEAMNDFTNSIRIDNKYADGYYGTAMIYRDGRKYDLAETNLNKAIEFAKDNEEKAKYLSGLASLYNSKKDYSKAIEYINEAIKLNDMSDFYNTLGLSLIANNQKKEAEEAWLTGIKKDNFKQIEYKHHIYRHLASYYYNDGKYDEAANYIEKALELSPGNERYLNLLNDIKRKMQARPK